MSGIVYDFDPYTSNLREFWPTLEANISGIKPSQTKMDPPLESLLSQLSFGSVESCATTLQIGVLPQNCFEVRSVLSRPGGTDLVHFLLQNSSGDTPICKVGWFVRCII